MSEEKKVHVEYYAHFREVLDTPSEEVETASGTVREFFEELDRRHAFGVPFENTRAAVNHHIVSWDTPIKTGDTVVFLTPFGGG